MPMVVKEIPCLSYKLKISLLVKIDTQEHNYHLQMQLILRWGRRDPTLAGQEKLKFGPYLLAWELGSDPRVYLVCLCLCLLGLDTHLRRKVNGLKLKNIEENLCLSGRSDGA